MFCVPSGVIANFAMVPKFKESARKSPRRLGKTGVAGEFHLELGLTSNILRCSPCLQPTSTDLLQLEPDRGSRRSSDAHRSIGAAFPTPRDLPLADALGVAWTRYEALAGP
jgi:hypothetical protein